MNSVTVIGGSIAGLSAALMLARAGHPVTILERDPEPLPDTLAEAASWDRPTVPQTHHEPISDVAVMGGLGNVLRDPLGAGSAQVHGLHAIGDALCTTNPAFGRGLSMALQHAGAVADGVSAEPDRPDRQADLIARRLSRLTRPVWADTVTHDTERSYRWRQTVHAAPGAVPAPRAVSTPTALRAAAADRRIGLRLLRAIHLLDSPSQFFDDEALAAAITGLDAPELPSVGSRAAALAAGHAVLTGRV